ncbi:MAG: hypothetical protein IFK92_03250 [Acidobacteria bacterium]|nr:hypothetical protein [Candidatus Sulfomarinibacter kjeldsenii]
MKSRLALAVAWTPEFREAPEFRWLQAWVRVQAESLWDEVELVEDLPPGEIASETLIVGERCLLGRRSLAAMRQSLAEGAIAAVPRRLAESGRVTRLDPRR